MARHVPLPWATQRKKARPARIGALALHGGNGTDVRGGCSGSQHTGSSSREQERRRQTVRNKRKRETCSCPESPLNHQSAAYPAASCILFLLGICLFFRGRLSIVLTASFFLTSVRYPCLPCSLQNVFGRSHLLQQLDFCYAEPS